MWSVRDATDCIVNKGVLFLASVCDECARQFSRAVAGLGAVSWIMDRAGGAGGAPELVAAETPTDAEQTDSPHKYRMPRAAWVATRWPVNWLGRVSMQCVIATRVMSTSLI